MKQLQFLSHQSKIASKIELFTFLPSGQQQLQTSQLALQDIQFKRLGYLSLDPNDRSGFQARELKSVYVDAPALLLKLIFHKCHLNNFNVFNQIGLIALNCIGSNNLTGSVDVSSSASSLQSAPSSSTQMKRQSDYEGLDAEMVNKIKILEQIKDKAVAQERFDDAKRIKESIDRLRVCGIQMQQLEERKRMATMNEDYDAAKIIKLEIDKIRQASYNP